MLLLTDITDWLLLIGEAVNDLSEEFRETVDEEIEFVFLTVIDPRRIGILEGVAGLPVPVNILCESRDTESKDAGPDDGILLGGIEVIFS